MADLVYSAREINIFDYEVLRCIPDPEPLIEDFIDTNSFSIIYGDPSAGKSFVALSICHAVSVGREWMGKKCKKGSALYIYGEGSTGIKNRCKALVHEYGEFGDIRFIGPTIDLQGSNDYQLIIDKLRSIEFNPDLIVIDTLARTFGSGNENETADMNRFVNHLGEMISTLKCTVLVIQHMSKSDKSQPRGHSSLLGAADSAIELKSKGHRENKVLTLSSKKQKEREDFKSFNLKLKQIKLTETLNSAVVILAGSTLGASNSQALSEPLKAVLKCFASRTGQTKSAICLEHTNIARGSYYRHLDKLVGMDFLEKSEGGSNVTYRITKKGQDLAISLGLVSKDSHDSSQSQLSRVSLPQWGDTDGSDNNDDNGIIDLNAIVNEPDSES